MKADLVTALTCITLTATSGVAQSTPRPFPLAVVSATVLGEDAEFGSIVGATMGPDGNVYVVDHLNCSVSAIAPSGRLLWKVGRKGGGPGEFRLPYRVAAARDGTVQVFDLGTGDVTTLTHDGRFVERTPLPLKFPYVDDILASGGELLVSGYARGAPSARRHGVHRFRRSAGRLVYVGSFAPLPTVRDTAVLQYWGAGDIAWASSGDVLFALDLPYAIYRFDATGRQKSLTRAPFRTRGTPDDAVRVERQGRITSVRNTEAVVERPASIVEVANGWLLVSRVSSETLFWDLFTATGAYLGSRPLPREWGTAVAFDPARNLLWMVATHDDAPVLVRVQLASGAQSSSGRRP